jgi:putative transcriptional regulator
MIGKLLVASPSILNDHVFSRSVILMIENSGTGSMGFIVNKQTNYCLDDLIQGSKLNVPLFEGGPVNNDKLFISTTIKIFQNQIKSVKIYFGVVILIL